MKNLIIGSDGFIGSALSEYLIKINEEVVSVDIKRGKNEDARFLKFFLDDVDRIYFLAWDVGGAKYLYKDDSQLIQLEWNLSLLTNIMKQLGKKDKPFLFVSSQLAEECDTVYGVTKRLGEVWTRLINGFFVRQWNVYGPIEQENIRSHVVSDFINQALNTGVIRMMTTGEEKRQFIHVDDVCAAWHQVFEGNLRGVYDVTSFEWVRIIDVAQIIAELTNATIIRGDVIGSTPLTPIRGKIPNWYPKIRLEDGLKRTVENFKSKRNE